LDIWGKGLAIEFTEREFSDGVSEGHRLASFCWGLLGLSAVNLVFIQLLMSSHWDRRLTLIYQMAEQQNSS
jgi:hypothetical protein